jgi:hypothetical protein
VAYIILSIIGLVALILVKSNWNRKKQIIFFFSVLIGGLSVYIIIDLMAKPDVIEKGPASWMAEIPWFEMGLYFIMLAGMVAKYFYDAIGEGNQIRFQKWQFFKPIFISPIVFGIIYGSIGKETSVLLLLIFSFQNGFFWQTVLHKT